MGSSYSLSSWDYLVLFCLRPLFAILFVFSVLLLGWWLAWKLVLVHVPLVQEIFGLRKKSAKPEPPKRRFSQFYNSLDASRSRIPPPGRQWLEFPSLYGRAMQVDHGSSLSQNLVFWPTLCFDFL